MEMNAATLNDLDQLVEDAMNEWQVPGLAIAVVRAGEPDLIRVYGQRDVEAGLPVTTRTQFTICSITKSFTALGLGMLVDERRLDWTKPVREYIPEFRLHDSVATDRITVQDLLCHHSGLPRHDWIWAPGDRSREEMLAALRYLKPSKDIRAHFQYSNLGYMVAGMVAERITGQAWEDFTRARIMTPLGMTDFGFSAADLQSAGDSAWPYASIDEEPGVFVRKRAKLWPIRNTPAGGINASVTDMASYMRLYLEDGKRDGIQLVSPSALQAMQTPRVYSFRSEFEEIGDTHYGFGLSCLYYRGERVVAHDGGWIGWSTRMTMMPDRRCGIVILSNRSPGTILDLVSMPIFDRLCGKEPINWFDRLRASRDNFITQRKADQSARQTLRKPGIKPTRPLHDYSGDYDHPGYGRLTIDVDGDALRWSFHGLSGPLDHRIYDVFEVPENLMELSPDLLMITFLYDRDGTIDRLTAPFETQVGDIVFRRVGSGEGLDLAFRKRCVGTYEHGSTKHVVALDTEDQLTLSPTGQPTYSLVPHQGRVFTIKELDGYRVEFQPDESGALDTIVFRQPNGTFFGRRVAG